MNVRVLGQDEHLVLELAKGAALYRIPVTEHDLRNLDTIQRRTLSQFELARRRAMSRCCPETSGEHACGLAPGHRGQLVHQCRACPEIWPVVREGVS